ncbi:MAG TPA: hypothetical protein V6C97_32375 [Oculatellaceae cyanobacterium]
MDLAFPLVLFNALILGFRHGIDWDHIAAITDLVGTTSNTTFNGGAISVGIPKNALRLPTFYAVGHAVMVFCLGLTAIFFATTIPVLQNSFEPVMGRVVGMTLFLLGGWIFYSAFRCARDGHQFAPQSRWMLLWKLLRTVFAARINNGEKRQPEELVAFVIGLIHGIGAETATQIMLIAAVSGGTSHTASIMILSFFVLGLIVSNSVVAVVSCSGYMCASFFKPLTVMTSVLTGIFSCLVGLRLISGSGGHFLNIHG